MQSITEAYVVVRQSNLRLKSMLDCKITMLPFLHIAPSPCLSALQLTSELL